MDENRQPGSMKDSIIESQDYEMMNRQQRTAIRERNKVNYMGLIILPWQEIILAFQAQEVLAFERQLREDSKKSQYFDNITALADAVLICLPAPA